MSDVTIGNGNGTYNVNGSQGGTITVGSGNDTVVVTGGSGQTVTVGNGNDSLTVTGAAGDTIKAGSGNDTIVVTGGSGQTITAGNGNDSVTITGATGDTITVGNGNDRVVVSGGSGNTITAGNGNVTVVASADHNDTITVGNGNATVYLAVNDTVNEGKGSDLVVLPSTTPTLSGPASLTVLEDHSIGVGISASLSSLGFGQETVNGFAAADQLQFTTSQFANFAAVMAAAQQVGQSTVITASATDSITLTNVKLSSLKANNFVFVSGATGANVIVTITGVPSDATLSSVSNPGGVTYNAATQTWTVNAAALTDLKLNAGEVTNATLNVTATDSVTGYSVSETVMVTVNPVAPTLTAPASLTVNEDGSIALGITETPFDPRDTVAIRITGVPADATLSAGTKNTDGSWSLTPAQLSGLELNAGEVTNATLSVTATSRRTPPPTTATRRCTSSGRIRATAAPAGPISPGPPAPPTRCRTVIRASSSARRRSPPTPTTTRPRRSSAPRPE